jgi:hypothetical protein
MFWRLLVKMIDEKFETSRGKHHLYTVRSMGPEQGFGVVDRVPLELWRHA